MRRISYNYPINFRENDRKEDSMKTVCLVFNNRENFAVCDMLLRNLKYVLEDEIEARICFLEELRHDEVVEADLFVVLYEDRVYAMKEYTSSLDKVIVMGRTIQRQFLPEVFSIPEGTNVLVVNDSRESTLQVANNLYELGLNHLNLIPYLAGENPAQYAGITIAITPDEKVPSFIQKVINIQNRYIDVNTFIRIINKLGLHSERVTRNLLQYTQMVAENNKGINQHYVAEHLKTEMLKRTIRDTKNAILIVDQELRTVYVNEKAQVLLGIDDREGVNISGFFDETMTEMICGEEFDNQLVQFRGSNYIITKIDVKIVDQVVGYSLLFNDVKDIKNMENALNKQLVKSGLIAKYTFDDICCDSRAIEKAIEIAKKAALSDYTVLISGESGTGKEMFAQSIHNYSWRSSQPFVAINCAALPESLLESELFGYEKGAFTGASVNGKPGLFEQASRGTIFLDEIGDMSLNLQARLLRVLQEKQIMRLGSDRVIDVDIRIIAATNKDLREAMEKKEFREDLYYRLSNIPVELPPLRERPEEILKLMEGFLGRVYSNLHEAEKQALRSYEWPGNVRELKNAADYYMLLGELPKNIGEEREPQRFTMEQEGQVPLHRPKAEGTDIRDLILAIIRTHTEMDCGIGRTAILWELKRRGIHLSDDKARKLLHELKTEGVIEIGKGRRGCRAI